MKTSALTQFLHCLRVRMSRAELARDDDRQLLDKFSSQEDQDAFTVLLERYGPMVFGVCRRVLGSEHDAEDAFAATFLVLIKKAGSLRKKESLAGWLHGVAYRVALKAGSRLAQRQRVERNSFSHEEHPAMDAVTWNELRVVLDEEIERLPAKLRQPLVLCCLQEKTHAEAAAELAWPRSSVTARLTQAKDMLCKRLIRRGVEMTPVLLAGMLAESTAKAALPAGLLVATARLATLWAAGETAAASSVSAGAIALAKETLKGMLAMKVKLVLLTMALGLTVAGVGVAEYPGFGSSGAKSRQQQRPPAGAAIAAQQPKPKAEQPRVDVDGNPLPPGALVRLGSLRWLHDGYVFFAAFLPDGKSVVTTSEDKTIRVWEFPTGKEIRRINLPINPFEVALSKDGKTIATNNSAETEIYLHDIASGKELKTLKWEPGKESKKGKGQGRQVGGMVFSPDGLHLAVQEFGGNVRIWDWVNGKEVRNVPIGGPPFLAYAPDGKALATLASDRVKLWDPTNGAEIRTIGDNSSIGVIDFALFSPDGKTLAISSNQGVFLMEVATGKEIHKLPIKSPMTGSPMSAAAVFNKDGSKLYIFPSVSRQIGFGPGVTETTVMEWEVATGILLREQGTPKLGGIARVSLSPDGNTFVAKGIRRPTFLKLAGGKEIVTTLNDPLAATPMIHFMPDGKTLLTSRTKWDAATGKYLGKSPLTNSSGPFSISPDGTVLAHLQRQEKAGDKVYIIDAASGKEIGQIPVDAPVSAGWLMRLSPDGKSLAVWQGLNRQIDLYDAVTGKLLRKLAALPGEASTKIPGAKQMVFSADGKLLAVWETQTSLGGKGPAPVGLTLVTLFDGASGKRTGVLSLPGGLTGGAGERAAFSTDGRCLALNWTDGRVALYELASGKPRGFFGMALPQMETPALGGGKGIGIGGGMPLCLSLSTDGKLIAHAHADGIVHVSDVRTGRELAAFKGHTGEVYWLAFSPDGLRVASSSIADQTALVWDLSKIKRPALPAKALAPADLAACWEALADQDAGKAFAKMLDLAAAAKDAVPFIKDRLKPALSLDPKRIAELLNQLDNNQYKVRAVAVDELHKLGEQIVPDLDKALAANPPLETKQRLEELRGKLTGMILQSDRLRAYRAIEVLELIGTTDARAVLQSLADGAADSLVTISAQAALKR